MRKNRLGSCFFTGRNSVKVKRDKVVYTGTKLFYTCVNYILKGHQIFPTILAGITHWSNSFSVT